MRVKELEVPGSYLFAPSIVEDERGSFSEWFRRHSFGEAVGHDFGLAQANWSTSRRGVVRGIHYADVPPGQAKYVTCVRGTVLDVIVDLRVGSPTFGRHDAVELGERDRKAVYMSEGLGHGFCALTDDATVLYLCSAVYNPLAERGIYALDPALGLPWPASLPVMLSPKDQVAPSLAEAREARVLPTDEACTAWARSLRGGALTVGAHR